MKELDEDGKYLFRALLPSKQRENIFKEHNYLAGLLILIDSCHFDSVNHVPCEQLVKSLTELAPVIKRSYMNNNMFRKGKAKLELPTVVFMTPTGSEPEMCPSNANLENMINACKRCVELQKGFKCRFGADLNSTMSHFVDQDLFKQYPSFCAHKALRFVGLL